MQIEPILQMAADLVPYLIGVVLGTIVALATGVLLSLKRRVPVAGAMAGVAIAALSGALLATWADLGAASSADPMQALMLAATTRFAAWMMLSITGALALILLAAAGLRTGARNLRLAGATLAVTLLVAGMVGVLGSSGVNPPYAWLRALEYAGLGLLAAVAMLGVSDDSASSDAAGAAVAVWAMVVAACEAAGRGMALIFLLRGLPTKPVANRAAIVDGFFDVVNGDLVLNYAALALALAIGCAAIALANRARPAVIGSGIGLLVLTVALVWFGGDSTPARVSAAAALAPPPAVEAPAPAEGATPPADP